MPQFRDGRSRHCEATHAAARGDVACRAAFVAGTFKETTKTKKNRFVSFFPQLRDRLKLWAIEADAGRNVELSGWVFPNQRDSNPINVNDISSSTLGNLGADVRWRLEFE